MAVASQGPQRRRIRERGAHHRPRSGSGEVLQGQAHPGPRGAAQRRLRPDHERRCRRRFGDAGLAAVHRRPGGRPARSYHHAGVPVLGAAERHVRQHALGGPGRRGEGLVPGHLRSHRQLSRRQRRDGGQRLDDHPRHLDAGGFPGHGCGPRESAVPTPHRVRRSRAIRQCHGRGELPRRARRRPQANVSGQSGTALRSVPIEKGCPMKNIFRKSSGLAPVLGILASLAGAVLHADSACVPVANGVPGTVLFTHPPNWWDPAPGAPLYNTALDAPSWRGAVAYGYANGAATTEEVHFRGLHRDDGLGNEFLYLSWWGKVVPSVTAGSNALWFGFHDGAGLGQDVAIGIQLVASADQAALQTGYVPTILVKPAGSADSAWAAYAGVPTVPAWINGAGAAGTARLWIQNAPSSWAVQVRVPITTSSDLNNGVRITSPFKSWYEFRAGTPDLITFPNGYITYKLPRAVADMDPVSGLPPAIAQWADARLTTGTPESPDPLCPTDGVSLKAENIGTNNPDPHSINLVSPNTLFAKPFNGSLTTAANNVRARFRIANWG